MFSREHSRDTGHQIPLTTTSYPAQTPYVGIDKRIESDFDPARQWPFGSPLTTLR